MVSGLNSVLRTRAVKIGAVLWLLTGLLFVAQLVTAIGWVDPAYSWTHRPISDLGVTGCGAFDDLGEHTRTICSPLHAVFNVAMVVTGAMVAVGGWLLRDAWATRATRIAMIMMVPVGLAIAAVGMMPWDRLPDLHDLVATAQWGLQLVAMLLCVSLIRDRRPGSRPLAVGTGVAVVVSLSGFVLFLAGPDAQALVGWGLAERLAFDVLTVWTMVVGAHVLARRPWRGPHQ